MTIASLFVKLGVGGVDNVKGGLQGVRTGLENVRTTSLEVKAAIAAALYGLQRLTAAAGVAGTNLKNFETVTGLSAQTLQRWQYAGNLVGIEADEVAQNIKGMQSALQTFAVTGKGAEGLQHIAATLKAAGHSLEAFDLTEQGYVVRDAFKVAEDFQKYAQIEKNPVLAQAMLKTVGFTERFSAGMQNNAFNPGVLNKAPVHSDKAIGALAGVDTAWRGLGASIKFAFEKLTAEHGMKVIKDLAKLVPQVLELVQAFVKLADKLHLFELLGKVFEGWTLIFKELTGAAGTFGEEFGKTAKDIEEKGFWGKAKDVLKKSVTGEYDREDRKRFQEMSNPQFKLQQPAQNPNKGNQQKPQVNVNTHVYGVTDAEGVGAYVGEAVGEAVGQYNKGGF